VPDGTFSTVSDVAVLPVSKFARSLDPFVEPACTEYEVGASPPAGAVQFNTTVEPVTVAEKFVGAPGALMAPAVAGRNGATGVRTEGQSDVPNVPVPAARVKQDHEMAALALVTAELGPDTPMPDGAAGLRPDPPPHAATAIDTVTKKTYEDDRMGSLLPLAHAMLKNARSFRQIGASIESRTLALTLSIRR
jgi:hypothetical protein